MKSNEATQATVSVDFIENGAVVEVDGRDAVTDTSDAKSATFQVPETTESRVSTIQVRNPDGQRSQIIQMKRVASLEAIDSGVKKEANPNFFIEGIGVKK